MNEKIKWRNNTFYMKFLYTILKHANPILCITFIYLRTESIKKCMTITKIRIVATTGRLEKMVSRGMAQEFQPKCFMMFYFINWVVYLLLIISFCIAYIFYKF